MPTFQEAVDYLIREGYIRKVKTRYVITAKFNQAMGGIDAGLVELTSGQVAVREPQLGVVTDWSQRYIQFIVDAEVPRRGMDSQHRPYDMNKFSKDGLKAFREALEKNGFNYELLVQSTKLYYKGSVQYKQTIGNYMSQGTYLSDYMNFIEAMRGNTLSEHIEENLEEDGGIAYQLG